MCSLKALFIRSYESNIPKFFLNQALYNFMLFAPIWVIFLQRKHGLSLTQITFIDFAFWITMALTEVPTGAVADTIGRKYSIFIGVILSILTVLFFALAPTYPLLLLANSLWPIAFTFISGADMAFFYDSLRMLGREAEYSRLRGRVLVVEIASAGISGVLGGLLTLWQPVAPFVLYAGILVIALLITMSFKEPPREPDSESGLQLDYLQTLKIAFGAIRKHTTLRWALLFSNLLPLATSAINITFIQPHAIAIGVPLAAMGVVTLGINLVRMAGSENAGRLVKHMGERRWLGTAAFLVSLGVIGLGAIHSLAGLVVFGLAAFASAASRPLVEMLILRQTPGAVRATILSVDNLLFRLFLALIEPGVGAVADAYSLQVGFMVMGLGGGLVLGVVCLNWFRRFESETAGKASTATILD